MSRMAFCNIYVRTSPRACVLELTEKIDTLNFVEKRERREKNELVRLHDGWN